MSGVGHTLGTLPRPLVQSAAAAALQEDLGHGARDITSEAVIAKDLTARAGVTPRHSITVAGLQLAAAAFAQVDPDLEFDAHFTDGDRVKGGESLASLIGSARSILMAERVALNYLGRLSGIATATQRAVDAVAGTRARIASTRKTTPGWRPLETYAVRSGGGINHRLGLDDGILIKDNHLALTGGVAGAVAAAKRMGGHMVRIEVEVETLEQLDAALAAGVDAVLLDNMTSEQLAEAVTRINGRAIAEASGGVDPASVAAVAASGVDVISMGWLTHSAPAADIGLDLPHLPQLPDA